MLLELRLAMRSSNSRESIRGQPHRLRSSLSLDVPRVNEVGTRNQGPIRSFRLAISLILLYYCYISIMHHHEVSRKTTRHKTLSFDFEAN